MIKTIALLLPLFVLPFTMTSAKEHKRGGGMKELNLSEEQREKIRSIRKAIKPQMKALKKESRELRKGLQEALRSEASESDLRSKFQALQNKKSAIASLRFDQMLKIRANLTPEQRKKFKMKSGDGHRGKREKRHRGDSDEE